MYIILDKNLKRVATLSTNSDANPFWGEVVERQIADDNSNSDDGITGVSTFNSTDPNANSKSWNDTLTGLTMLQSAPAAQYLTVGNSVAVYDDVHNHWRIYRIYQVDENIDATSGAHLVTVDAINLAIYKLNKTIPPQKEIKDCKLDQAMQWIMADTGWDLQNNCSSGLFADINFDGTSSSQAALQTVLSTYDAEADAYCHIDANGIVTDLILELADQLGEDEGKSITYGQNMLSVQRETVDTNLVTKLYIVGANNASIASVNNGKNYITDVSANSLYNTDQNTWLEGTITSDTITEPKALLDWGLRELRLYNHPRINYAVEVTQDFQANLGDTIKVIDLSMNPILTTEARVIQQTTSESDPSQNKVVLGEFSTVKVITPAFIRNMEQRWNDHVKKLFEEARENANAATVSLITPLGSTWYNTDTSKRVIARLFIEGENVTSYLSPQAFNWQKINMDGTRDIGWEADHAKDGYQVTIEPPFVGTLLVTIDDTYVKDEAEMWIDTSNSADGSWNKLWETKDAANKDFNGDQHIGALQFSYLLSDGSVLSSYHYTKDKSHSDCEFIKWNADGTLQSMMFVTGGGHCGSFGYDESSNTIYTEIKDPIDGKYYLVTMTYQANTSASNITKWCQVKQYFRVNVDLKNNLWLGSTTSGKVYVCQISDLQAGNFKPIIEFKLQDFKWKPLPARTINTGTYNTLQANGISYPFAFFTAGDMNNADDKHVMCINLITQSMVFDYVVEPMQDIKLAVPLENGGHLEPEGVYEDITNSRLIVGFNVSEYRDDAHTISIAHSALYTVPLGIRDDSRDLVVKYPEQDEGENDEAEQPVITGNDNADDSDASSDSDEDGDESIGEGTKIEDGDSN
ncbi:MULTISPECIES: phage tail spike protein [Lentilactobacillus]|uniref:Phage minor structural protein n=1 Tax=Lentilactobacillus buchneri subsp. silagei CD034 TaxID=1071400 RepID=J9W6M0_LENBU|nr:phage tail spike protein [Lentilactobacillus buchneri]AFS00595.1 phage minor structural protein [Lentilactobacillus buchneri subsp. silagei CD034]